MATIIFLENYLAWPFWSVFRIFCGLILLVDVGGGMKGALEKNTLLLASGGPSQGQEIDGKAGVIPARYRHCDVIWDSFGTR